MRGRCEHHVVVAPGTRSVLKSRAIDKRSVGLKVRLMLHDQQAQSNQPAASAASRGRVGGAWFACHPLRSSDHPSRAINGASVRLRAWSFWRIAVM